MPYRKFVAFSLAGSTLWISSLVYAGYLFGNIPWVKNNLSLIVVGIVAVSLIPVASTWWREHRAARGR
jgi:membrane-associated protein